MKKRLPDNFKELILKLREKNFTYREIESLVGFSRTAIHNYVMKASGKEPIKQKRKKNKPTKFKVSVSYPVQLMFAVGLDSGIERMARKKSRSSGMNAGYRSMVFEFPNKLTANNAIKRITKLHSQIEVKLEE